MIRLEMINLIAPIDDDAYVFRIVLVVHPTKAEDNIVKRTSFKLGDSRVDMKIPISLLQIMLELNLSILDEAYL